MVVKNALTNERFGGRLASTFFEKHGVRFQDGGETIAAWGHRLVEEEHNCMNIRPRTKKRHEALCRLRRDVLHNNFAIAAKVWGNRG